MIHHNITSFNLPKPGNRYQVLNAFLKVTPLHTAARVVTECGMLCFIALSHQSRTTLKYFWDFRSLGTVKFYYHFWHLQFSRGKMNGCLNLQISDSPCNEFSSLAGLLLILECTSSTLACDTRKKIHCIVIFGNNKNGPFHLSMINLHSVLGNLFYLWIQKQRLRKSK